jgi:hypothetical protein
MTKINYCIACENPMPCTCATKEEVDLIKVDSRKQKVYTRTLVVSPGKKRR